MRKLAACVVCFVFLVGCASYYKVTDPASRSIYYTKDIDQITSGAVKFKDVKSGSEVILQSSEVKEIDSKEFKEGTEHPQPVEKN